MGTLRMIVDAKLRIPKRDVDALARELARRSEYFDRLPTARRRSLSAAEVFDLLANEEPRWAFVFDARGNIEGVRQSDTTYAGWEADILQVIARFVDGGYVRFEVESTVYRARFRDGDCIYQIENDGEDFLGLVESDA